MSSWAARQVRYLDKGKSGSVDEICPERLTNTERRRESPLFD